MRLSLSTIPIVFSILAPGLALAQGAWEEAPAEETAPEETPFEAPSSDASRLADPSSEEASEATEESTASEEESSSNEATPKTTTKVEADTVIVLETGGPKEAERQRTRRVHDGFYLRTSLGHAWMGARFSEGLLAEDKAHGTGGAFDLQLGGTPSPGLVVGAGLFLNGVDSEDVRPLGTSPDHDDPATIGLIALGPFIDYFPDPESGFHFGGTLGLAGLFIDSHDLDDSEMFSDEDARGAVGGAFGAWVGYDWFVGREWSLGMQLRYLGAFTENEEYGWEAAADTLSLQFTALYH